MKNIGIIGLGSLAALLIGNTASHACHMHDVTWADNGHTYTLASIDAICSDAGCLTWEDTLTAVENYNTSNGTSYYLATITSAEENAFIQKSFLEYSYSAWVGGFQADGQLSTGAGWQWVTGEEFTYTNWNGGEPNDWGASEDDEDNEENYLMYYSNGLWNDEGGSLCAAILETGSYTQDPVPEPATMILFGAGITGLVAGARRKKKNKLIG